VGSRESEVEAIKARDREAHDECRGAKENCGCAAEEMGSGEGAQRLTRQQNADEERSEAWEIILRFP
jgi:hypothetical protein